MAAQSPSTFRRKKKGESAREDALSWMDQAYQLAAILVIAAAVAAPTFKVSNWINDRRLPFCDRNSRLSENCVPCPEHGVCQGGQLECLIGYRRQGRHCVDDVYIDKGAEKLAGDWKDYVCSVNAISFCNGAGKVWFTEDEIMDAVKPDLQGRNLWLVQEKAVGIASNILDTDIHGGRVFCCPGNLVDGYKPLGCRIREWCFQNIFKLLLGIPLISVMTFHVLKYWRYRRRLGRAEQLYIKVCEALETKAMGDIPESPGNETWIVASRLRDHLLKPDERKNRPLWAEVERLVQEDTRIDQYPRIIKGDSRIVWEWQVEGSMGTTLNKKKKTGTSVERKGDIPVRVNNVKQEKIYKMEPVRM